MKTLHFFMITIFVLFASLIVMADAFAQNDTRPPQNDLGDGNPFFMTVKGSFLPGQLVEISGNLVTVGPIQIVLDNPQGMMKASKTTFSDRDGYFASELKIPADAEAGNWTIVGASGIYHKELNFTILGNSDTVTCYAGNLCSKPIANTTVQYGPKTTVSIGMKSPLEQFKSGIASKDVKCENNLQLIIKAEDGSPACVKPDTAIALVNHRWATNVLQPNPMAGLNNDTGIATLKNQAYYFETANYTDDAYHHPVQISFHDVIFTLFPSGFRGGLPAWGCGGSYYWADAKFSDGTSELLQIFVGDQQCFVPQPVTHFSNHTNPQAGLTFYNGKMKLLVGTKNTLESSTRLHPIGIVSIQFVPTPPNPGGPTMQLTLMNIGMKPVTNLNATLVLNNNYVFNFKDVTESNPLAPGHSTSDTEMLIGVGSTEMTYPLTVVGTENNETFSYTLNIHIPYTNENEIIKVGK